MHARNRRPGSAAIIGLIIGCISGCGLDPWSGEGAARLTGENACPRAPRPADAGTLVVLDWDGGISTQTGDRALAAFDVGALRFSDDSSGDANLAARFRDAVQARVQVILCDLEPADVAVIAGDADDHPGATAVHITGDAPANGGKHIGQSDFDPCNARAVDAAVIWGGALAARIPPGDFDAWVNVVANTTAHEIGHTLGFAHPTEQSVGRLVPLPTAEIMRANVKPSELQAEQSFLIEQNTCPNTGPGLVSYTLIPEFDRIVPE
jgi:hypothetical protein